MCAETGDLPKLKVIDWGLTHYAEAFEWQKELVNQRKNDSTTNTLVFTEHYPVYTIGLRKGAEQHLVWNESICSAKGIEIHQSNRGGDITYHGPGQIVGYPVISLRQRRDLHGYLRNLETVVINTLKKFKLESDRRKGKTGIWLGERKICAIGVAVRSWVTYHGFALNVSPDMGHFSGIIPCGITDGSVTSMELELNKKVDTVSVKTALAVEFENVFKTLSS